MADFRHRHTDIKICIPCTEPCGEEWCRKLDSMCNPPSETCSVEHGCRDPNPRDDWNPWKSAAKAHPNPVLLAAREETIVAGDVAEDQGHRLEVERWKQQAIQMCWIILWGVLLILLVWLTWLSWRRMKRVSKKGQEGEEAGPVMATARKVEVEVGETKERSTG